MENKEDKKILEPNLNPEYIGKLKKIEKEGKFINFNSISDLKRDIENL